MKTLRAVVAVGLMLLLAGFITQVDWLQIKNKPILSVASFSGADLAAKTTACIASLPALGGVCDARSSTGAQSWGSSVTIPANVEVWFGGSTVTATALPALKLTGFGSKVLGTMTKLVTTGNSNQVILIGKNAVQTEHAQVEGLWLYGTGTTGTVHGIEVDGGWSTIIRRNRIEGFSGDGVLVTDAAPDGTNVGSFFVEISESKMLNNGGGGIHLKAYTASSITLTDIRSDWIYGNGTNVLLDASQGANGSIFWTSFNNTDLEAAVGDGLKLVGANVADTWLNTGVIEGSGGYGINRDTNSNKLKIASSFVFANNVSGDIKAVAAGGTASMLYGSQTPGITNIQPQGWVLQHHIGPITEGDRYEIGVNLTPTDATHGNLDDTSLGGTLLRVDQGTGLVSIYAATAGANPRTLALLFQVDNSGNLYAPLLPSVAPAGGSKAFWYDPADGNTVKFVP